MKTKGDQRVWLDRYQGREEFGVFSDQKFYSVEYDGPNKDDVIAFAEKVAEFNAWCKAGYLEKRAGREIPPPPSFVTPTATAATKKRAATSKQTSTSSKEESTDGETRPDQSES